MAGYALRRVVQGAVLVVGASVVVFLLIHLAPGDPVVALAGEDGEPEYYAMMRARFGLDRPVWERLWVYLGRLARGDLGFSLRHNQSAVSVIVDRLPATLLLMVPALVIASALGIGAGTVAADRVRTRTDATIRVVSLAGYAVPVFWTAQLLLLLFALRLGWFPVQGMTTARAGHEGWRAALDVAHHMVLPVTALVAQYVAPITRITRSSVLEALGSPYVRAARARGLSRRRVLVGHALPNALLPVVTVTGAQVGFMVAGAVLTETVFAWPGLGRLLLTAMLARDFAIITAMFLLLSATIVVANLITDLLYSFIDPRVRYE